MAAKPNISDCTHESYGRATATVGFSEPPKTGTIPSLRRGSVYLFAIAVFVAISGLILAVFWNRLTVPVVVAALLVGVLAASSIRIAEQWERVIVVRLGRVARVAGPGPYFMIPIVEHDALHVDQRIMVSGFGAEKVLTADLAPVNVDAALFWMVWDPRKAYAEVNDYAESVLMSAQTALRDAIGQVGLTEVAAHRKQLDRAIKEDLEERCTPWGITVISVEIRNIVIPEELQTALSKEAQAERERNARLIMADVEREIADLYVEAGNTYKGNSEAMNLRTMNLVYESVKEGGSLVIAPSAFGDGLNVLKETAS